TTPNSLYLRAFKTSTNKWSSGAKAAPAITVYSPPQITQQPVSITSGTGTGAEFTVQASGSNLSYQWRKNGPPIPGATSATLSISNIGASDAGSYDVRITGRGGCQV